MKQTLSILSVLLVAQLGLAVGLNFTGQSLDAFEPTGKLLAAQPDAIDRVKIRDQDGKTVELAKKDDKWVIAGAGDFPVAKDKADKFVKELTKQSKGWPVATSSDAIERFKVDDDKFEAEISLFSKDDETGKLYLGTSPSYRYVHARPDGDDNVYSIAFDHYEASAKAKDWEDKTFLNLAAADITRTDFPGFVLERDKDDKVTLKGIKAKEKLDEQKAKDVVTLVANLSFDEVLGTEAKDDYGLKTPKLKFSAKLKDGKQIDYVLGKMKEGEDYVLKASSHPYYFKIAKWSAERFLDKKRVGLLVEEKAKDKKEDGKNNGS